jgi:peptidyl-prolyl cis-trans isomerase B (cyclophilin B)
MRENLNNNGLDCMIIFTTNLGDFEIELNTDKAPVSSKNFLTYCQSGFYEGTTFHRVIKGFMIQGGGFDQQMQEKPTRAPIVNEANRGLSNVIGSIAMARTDAPHSATAQFFINLDHNDFLDHTATTNQGWGYAVFGQVSAGMDVVNKIANVKTTSLYGHNDVPVSAIVIEKITIK